MKKKLMVISMMLAFLVSGCASAKSIKDFSKNYVENVQAVKDFAKISADDWLFGSGLLAGALSGVPNAEWIAEELEKIDKMFEDAEGNIIQDREFNDWELGYIMGVRARLMSPVASALIRYYLPSPLLQIAEVGIVLGFLGL